MPKYRIDDYYNLEAVERIDGNIIYLTFVLGVNIFLFTGKKHIINKD